MNNKDLLYKIALTFFSKIGNVNTKNLIAYTGSVEDIFKQKKSGLEKIPNIGTKLAQEIYSKKEIALEKAEKELKYISENNINARFFLDDDYPKRLKNCIDAPVMLYYKGNLDLNHPKIISIVGTRMATNYGKDKTNQLIEEIKNKGHDVVIVSGLAFGIDICSHKAALKNGLKTAAVVAHGLKNMYPADHKGYAKEIAENGAIITEFPHHVRPDRGFFVRRNRIIAGIADATIVVESAITGGALITANMANSYNRDVFAFPGRVKDKYSEGCNKLIKSNRAVLIEGAYDLEYILGWDKTVNNEPKQKELFIDLNNEEKLILNILRDQGSQPIDSIMLESNLSMGKISPVLLKLELSGLIKCLPGKVYEYL